MLLFYNLNNRITVALFNVSVLAMIELSIYSVRVVHDLNPFSGTLPLLM